jgi:hypothetical protein
MGQADDLIPALSNDRAQWSFGDLLNFHLFVHGTRPGGTTEEASQRWRLVEFADAVGTHPNVVRNWLDNKNLPVELLPIEPALFGDQRHYNEWRVQLRLAYHRAKEDKAATSRSARLADD